MRALVSKGWGNIGGTDVPDNVFLVGNVPHDWLFPHCSAVVHHGGAGTTAIGIALGLPTVVGKSSRRFKLRSGLTQTKSPSSETSRSGAI